MSPEDFNTRAHAAFGSGYIDAVSARLRVSDRHVRAWSEGRAEIPEQHVAGMESLFAARAAAEELVARWMERLHERAEEQGLQRSDIAAALARLPAIGAACIALNETRRRSFGHR